jgi:mannose-6-phosphate isomerase-like protein (cupin superfamily)
MRMTVLPSRIVLSTLTAAALFAAAMLALPGHAGAQTPPEAKLFAAAGDVSALIARAKAERKPDQANFVQPIVAMRPYTLNLEYRVAGINAPASVHEKDAELFFVVEGSGTLVTGGTLKDERRTNPDNLQGSAIDGGASRRLAKGDVVLVPEKTAHWFTSIDGTLVLMSLHLPH